LSAVEKYPSKRSKFHAENRIGFHDGAMRMVEYDANERKADFNEAISGLHSVVPALKVRAMSIRSG
jgi:hypothetical protein